VAEKNLPVANEIPNQLAIDFNKHSGHNTEEIDLHHGKSIYCPFHVSAFFLVVNFCCILATSKHKREHSVTTSLFFCKRFVNSQEKRRVLGENFATFPLSFGLGFSPIFFCFDSFLKACHQLMLNLCCQHTYLKSLLGCS
jgi:hypothetical protein